MYIQNEKGRCGVVEFVEVEKRKCFLIRPSSAIINPRTHVSPAQLQTAVQPSSASWRAVAQSLVGNESIDVGCSGGCETLVLDIRFDLKPD